MSERIHVLSLWRPWPATFFRTDLLYPKRIENRSKPPPKNVIGTWVCFHAGKTFDWDRLDMIQAHVPYKDGFTQETHPTGLLGMAYIAGFVTSIHDLPADQQRWWLGPVAYLVPHVIPFDEPIPCKGQQGWKFLGDEHAALIREKYGSLMVSHR